MIWAASGGLEIKKPFGLRVILIIIFQKPGPQASCGPGQRSPSLVEAAKVFFSLFSNLARKRITACPLSFCAFDT
jgi:hypothetical protein